MGWYGMFRGGSGWDGDSREVLVSNSDCSENCDCCWRQMWVTFAWLGNKKNGHLKEELELYNEVINALSGCSSNPI